MPLSTFSLFVAEYWTNQVAIWSHCVCASKEKCAKARRNQSEWSLSSWSLLPSCKNVCNGCRVSESSQNYFFHPTGARVSASEPSLLTGYWGRNWTLGRSLARQSCQSPPPSVSISVTKFWWNFTTCEKIVKVCQFFFLKKCANPSLFFFSFCLFNTFDSK